ncbi:hypothetical protein Nepgr_017586 [Nepenthes gracilis]|uniref:Sugar phosphate transporter domain-containing protein n=1 Tax=Nepenthes gracilis TaxID=150966 RepID=A0AAD3SRQ0_NEPGR|nr:hypothetical protein Nepgr_017586 [Nepenthes gracilis]
MENEKKSSALSDVGAWVMNVISSVGLIMADKQLMSSHGYAFSFVGLVSNATGYSVSKHVPVWELLCLMLNSVGFYQISKLSMIPVVCIMEWFLHSKRYSRDVKIAVLVVVIGVGVCTVTDVKVNAKGFLCAAVAVLSTSLQQISHSSYKPTQPWSELSFDTIFNMPRRLDINVKHFTAAVLIGSLQKKYSIGPFELLSKTAPFQALSLKCPRWLLFDSELTMKNILGMALAVIGMVIYSWAAEADKQAALAKAENSMTEEEIQLLKGTLENSSPKDIELGDSKA